jgi:hypothetical protein
MVTEFITLTSNCVHLHKHAMLVGGNERAWGAAANLDVNKRLIHKLGHLLIFKRLHLHHMAPSTSTHITT